MKIKVTKLRPSKCNLCGGRVVYISNEKVYGRQYGSGYCYYCENCRAYVGTHKVAPKEALGILANEEMRKMKMKCHDLFDAMWETPQERKRMYNWLSQKLGIKVDDCHFGYFDLEMLSKAYKILREKEDENEKK